MGSILTAAPPTCCYLLGGVVRADVVLSALHRRPLRRRRAGPYRLCAENGPRRAARNGPHRLNARAVTLLSGSSVAPVYRFLLMLRNGEAADPPAFLTEQPDWQPGDVFVAANGRAFRIVVPTPRSKSPACSSSTRSGRWNRSGNQRRNLSAKGVTNADVRPGPGHRHMALVPELFELSLSPREDESDSPEGESVQSVQSQTSSREL